MKKVLSFLFILTLLIRIENVSGVDEVSQESFSHIYGYIFIDSNHSGIMVEDSGRVADLEIKLWQGDNLVDKCVSNDQGYYEFKLSIRNGVYHLTAQLLEHYTVSQCVLHVQEGNHFVLNGEQEVKSYEIKVNETNIQNNMGLYPIEYRLTYDCNEGHGNLDDYQSLYHAGDTVPVLGHGTLIKEGYVFAGWSTQSDGGGLLYQEYETLIMPGHSLTLYASWKQILASSSSSLSKKIENPQSQSLNVKTDDETEVLLFSLLFLGSGGFIIVLKALKKRKNR